MTQPPPERGPMYQNDAKKIQPPINGRVQPEIDDYHDAFFTLKSNSIYDAFGPSTVEMETNFRVLEVRMKFIQG